MAKRHSNGEVRARLTAAAKRAMKNAHAPYSKFKVGAALLTTTDKIFLGCNVENASYGMTNCAERTAIFTAVAELGPKMEIRAIAVANNQNAPCSPCGACRQVMMELGGPDLIIIQANLRGAVAQFTMAALLPGAFALDPNTPRP